MTKVAVIIVLWNGEKYLEELFGSLARVNKNGLEVEVMAVDNASPDRCGEIVTERWPWVTLIKSKQNLMFAGGNNLAIRRAIEGGVDYVYLLNQDTEVTPDFLVEAVRAAAAEPKAAAIQSLMILSPEKELINSIGNAIHFLGFGYMNGYRLRLDEWRNSQSLSSRRRPGSPSGPSEIAYASGAAVLLRAVALKQVGLLDETLQHYHEDLDLGWRLRLNGWKNILAPASAIYHKYEFSRSIKKFFFMERNRYLVLFKNLRAWSIIVLAPWLLLSECALFLFAIRGGWAGEKLKVYRYFLSRAGWRYIRTERKKLAALRQVSDREIARLFSARISYQEVATPFVRYVANPLMSGLWAVLRVLIV